MCLHMLMNSIPAAIILGVLFDAIKAYSQFQLSGARRRQGGAGRGYAQNARETM